MKNLFSIAIARLRARTSRRGQSMVEFALILPILLALVGGGIDLSRVYEAQAVMQTATRNAAEYVASRSTAATAQADAQRVVCAEAAQLLGYEAGATPGTCTAPTVNVTFVLDTTGQGASTTYPVATATVTTSLDFKMLAAWMLLPQGEWTLDNDETFMATQGR